MWTLAKIFRDLYMQKMSICIKIMQSKLVVKISVKIFDAEFGDEY